jgi:hypothetical protein
MQKWRILLSFLLLAITGLVIWYLYYRQPPPAPSGLVYNTITHHRLIQGCVHLDTNAALSGNYVCSCPAPLTLAIQMTVFQTGIPCYTWHIPNN